MEYIIVPSRVRIYIADMFEIIKKSTHYLE